LQTLAGAIKTRLQITVLQSTARGAENPSFLSKLTTVTVDTVARVIKYNLLLPKSPPLEFFAECLCQRHDSFAGTTCQLVFYNRNFSISIQARAFNTVTEEAWFVCRGSASLSSND